jgi:hypothetical protein
MGDAPGPSFRLLEPLGTLVVSDQPEFRWEPLRGAESYTVSVADEALRTVAQSPPLQAPSWRPDQPLPRGRAYVWQVTARRGKEEVTTPVPPAPFARFAVADGETAARLDRTARAQPEAHLLLGILYTQAGARAEAQRHLAQVPRTDRHYEVARRTLERLRDPTGR